MSRVTREGFLNPDTRLDVTKLNVEDKAALARAGIDPAELARISGQDGIIEGKAELKELFAVVDRLDRNGRHDSLATTSLNAQGREVATPSGKALSALQEQIDVARLSDRLGSAREKSLVAAPKGTPGKDAAGARDPSWLKTAFGELGVKESAKEKTTARILEYFDRTYEKGKHSDDSGKANAWCAAFVTYSLAENKIKNNKAVGAREYQNWGEASEPFRGAIMVFEHGKQKHVAMLVGVTSEGKNVYLGGNQDNEVSLSTLDGYTALATRKPSGYEIPPALKSLPTVEATGGNSTR